MTKPTTTLYQGLIRDGASAEQCERIIAFAAALGLDPDDNLDAQCVRGTFSEGGLSAFDVEFACVVSEMEVYFDPRRLTPDRAAVTRTMYSRFAVDTIRWCELEVEDLVEARFGFTTHPTWLHNLVRALARQLQAEIRQIVLEHSLRLPGEDT